MHRLLQRLLKKSGLSADKIPGREEWDHFLDRLNETFVSNDEDRYLLERSLEISSQEMQELLEASRENYQRRLDALIKAIPDLIFYVDEDGFYLDILSKGREDLLYISKEKIIGRNIGDIFPSRYAKLFLEATRRAIEANRLEVIEYAMSVHGKHRDFEARIMPTNLLEKGRRTSITIVRDITAQKRSIQYLNVIKKIFEDATEGIFIISLDGSYVAANTAFCRMLGLKGRPSTDIKNYHRYLAREEWRALAKALRDKRNFRGEVTINWGDGSKILAWLTVDMIDNEQGEPTHGVAMLTDLSALQASREKLRFTATHDALTGLPNRLFLLEQLKGALARAKRSGQQGALLFIDLDNFKEVNDTSGHKVGDMVLIECTERIRRSIRGSDILGRLGGDEFLLIMEDIENYDAPVHVARKIIDTINRPFRMHGEWHDLGASIGIALFPYESDDVETLLQHADMAMYQAKQKGKNRVRYYSKELDDQIKRHHKIEQALKAALSHNRFSLVYQPQIDLQSDRIVGMEALLRLQDPILGSLSPAEFIPIAEESDLIIGIGRWVFEESCRQMQAWQSEKLENFTVGINVSRRQLMDEGLVEFVRDTVKRHAINPERIELEITETTFMHSREEGNCAIEMLQEEGFLFSIDDFGTGYSSLSNLKHFVVNRIKIDKSFIDDILVNDSDRAIVRASILLAHALGMRVVAEGVEQEAQRHLLTSMECDEIQGYLFSPPLPPAQITSMLLR